MSDRFEEIIPTFELFDGFTADGARRLIEGGTVQEHAAGDFVMREGEPSTFVVLVLVGRLSIHVERAGRDLVLTEEGPGEIVGEIGVLSGISRAASVRVIEPATLLRWKADDFRRLLLRDADFSQRMFGRLLRMLVEKERELIAALVRADGGS